LAPPAILAVSRDRTPGARASRRASAPPRRPTVAPRPARGPRSTADLARGRAAMAKGRASRGAWAGWSRAMGLAAPATGCHNAGPALVATCARRDARFAGLGRDLGPGTRQGQVPARGASATVGSWKGTSGRAVGGGSQGVRRRTRIGGGGAGRLRQTVVRAPWPPVDREQRGREERERTHLKIAVCRDICFCAIWILRGRREVMRWWGGYIEENAGGGCQFRHQLRRDRVREAVASTTRVDTSSQTFVRRDVLMIP
jgi:hypothetical protein